MKILLMEDDDGTASVLKNILAEHHYLVALTIDSQAGLFLAEAFAYNLVMLDVVLPKLDGVDLGRCYCRHSAVKM